jgi:UDPglucose 6-dehydrogenase
MKMAMIGSGYVGLVSGACFAEIGHDVVCVDTDEPKIAGLLEGRLPIYEPGLDEVVERNVQAGRLRFTTDLGAALEGVEVVFIAVGTPTRRGDGHADLTYVVAAAREIARRLDHPTVVVTKSTVPVGTGRRLQALFRDLRPDRAVEVASNPEFLREGSAVDDFLRPDRVVCGTESAAAEAALRRAYRPLNLNRMPVLFTTLETAELIKYATNSFLATKITFINEIADLCEQVGADVQEVAHGLGLDARIGRKFLHAGPGYGGSCFPKDTLALLRTAEFAGVPLRLVETVVAVNEQRKRSMIRKVLAAAGGSVASLTIGVLGVTFKPNTDDVRESPSLVILPALVAEGARVRAFDPEGMANARPLLDGVEWAESIEDALTGSDVLLLITEWNQFRGLDPRRIRALMRGNVVVDLRNVYDGDAMAAAGLVHTGIGKPPPVGQPG